MTNVWLEGYGNVAPERLLEWIKLAGPERREHRRRARERQRLYDAEPSQRTHLGIMIAAETSRGSRIRTRRMHEAWTRWLSGKRPTLTITVPL